MVAKKFVISRKIHVTKNWKTTFPKYFFNKIWLKVEEHENIYIFEIKLEKNILFKNGGQNKFPWHCAIMPILC